MKNMRSVVRLAAGLLPVWMVLSMRIWGMEGDNGKWGDGRQEGERVSMGQEDIANVGSAELNKESYGGQDWQNPEQGAGREISWVSYSRKWKEGQNGGKPVTTVRIIRK